MARRSLVFGAVAGGALTLPLIALSYLGEQWAQLPFVPFDLFDWLARILPGSVITAGIDSMVRLITLLGVGPISNTAKRIEQLTGGLLVLVGGMLAGLIVAAVRRTSTRPGRDLGLIAGAIVFGLVALVEISLHTPGNLMIKLAWLAFLILIWGALLGIWIGSMDDHVNAAAVGPEARASRRAFLARFAGGSIAVALGAWGLGRLLESQQEATGAGRALSSGASATATPASTPEPGITTGGVPAPGATATAAAAMRERVPAAPGTRPELTANDQFYRIDIDTRPPVLSQSSWKLEVKGSFDRPRSLTLSDLEAYPATTQTITQSCISNPVGGDLIGSTNYTGVRLRTVLQDLGLRPEATALYIRSADGFYETVTMQDLMDPRTLLVYGMNGETLPIEHGFPLRIYIPNRYGMKQPKWITSIEALDHEASGYWVDRGWSPTAHPQIVSVIDTVDKDQQQNGRVPIGGIAWAGDRGIQKVQVQTDGGEWEDAVLRTPPLSPLTWIQWRYDWPARPGRHTWRVRAMDGTGALQIETPQDTYPDGATGYHSASATI